MHKILRSFAITSMIAIPALISNQAMAVEGLSANVAATSNYLWRGVTQTDDAAGISGGIDYAASSGFYVGTWASNVDFGDDASHELDLYLGFAGEINSALSYDLGYIYYAYPDSAEHDNSNEYDFGEIYGSLTYQNFTFAANYGVNNDDLAEHVDSSLYLSADGEFEISDGLTLNVHLGNYSFDDDYDHMDYTDYGISLSKDGFTFGVSDTDQDNEDVTVYISYAMDIDL